MSTAEGEMMANNTKNNIPQVWNYTLFNTALIWPAIMKGVAYACEFKHNFDKNHSEKCHI